MLLLLEGYILKGHDNVFLDPKTITRVTSFGSIYY